MFEREIAAEKSLRCVASDIARQAAIDQQTAKCYDEWLKAKLCDEQSVCNADENRNPQHRRQCCPDAPSMMHKQPRQQATGQSNDRANRQIDSADDDYERYTDGDNPEQARPADGVLNIERL